MLFSKSVNAHRQTAWLMLLQAAPSTRPALRPIYTRFIAALHAAEEGFLETTEDERDAALTAQTAAHEAFLMTVNAGSEKHETLMSTLTDEVARTKATAAFHDLMRNADSVYDRAVGPTSLVLRIIEARAMVPYEVAARKAFDTFISEMQAAIIEPTENRSTCHAGSDRFLLQEEGGKR